MNENNYIQIQGAPECMAEIETKMIQLSKKNMLFS